MRRLRTLGIAEQMNPTFDQYADAMRVIRAAELEALKAENERLRVELAARQYEECPLGEWVEI